MIRSISAARSVTTAFVLGAFVASACGGTEQQEPSSTSEEPVSGVPGTAYLVALNSGKCADVSGASKTAGAAVIQWTCHDATNQQWQFKLVSGSTYSLVSVNSGQCMDVTGASTAAGAPVEQWPCNGGTNQQWKLSSVGSGEFRLQSVKSGLCLDVTGAVTTDGAKLEQWTCNGGGNQTFRLSSSGSGSGSGSSSSGSGGGGKGCDTPGLVWKTANETDFTSYPAPGSAECIQYSGCMYEGEFAACSKTESKTWVAAHNIISVFPDFNKLKLHDLCLKDPSNGDTIVATVLDECADSDCSGCCTQNRGSEDELIDVESYTYKRFNNNNTRIEWADLGPTTGSGCN